MKITKTLLLIWGFVLGLYILPRGYFGSIAFYGLVTVIFLTATVGSVLNVRGALKIALAITVLSLLRWLPMVCINIFMFLTGHELYQDSPATILVVVAIAVVFVIPPLSIYFSLFFERRQFVAAFGKATKESIVPAVEAESELHLNGQKS